jgi:CubicO group peptidase (beta-lactamase class C family)
MQARQLIAALVAWTFVVSASASNSASADELFPLPAQPADVPWPTEAWPEAASPAVAKDALAAQVAKAFASDAPQTLAGIRAVLVISRGAIVAEQYDTGFDASTKLVSWSVGKSFIHALAGIMVGDGEIALDSPLPVAEWQVTANDPRREITLDDALRMSSGLEFSELYADMAISDVIHMLFGPGFADMGHFAADKPLLHPPGDHWSYSSGTSNMISRVLRDLSGGTENSYRAFMQNRLFAPLGIRNVEAEFDNAGTFIGSSLIFMTARDYARFGLLYQRDGMWDGERLLPPGWVDHGRRETPASKGRYGAHWWLDGYADPPQVAGAKLAFPPDTFMARGHEEQSIIIVPSKDVIVVCLSLVTEYDLSDMRDYLAGIVALFPEQ